MDNFKKNIYGNSNPENEDFINAIYNIDGDNSNYSNSNRTDYNTNFNNNVEGNNNNKRRKTRKALSNKSKAILLLVLCIVFSGCFGFTGAAIYNNLNSGSGNNHSTSVGTTSKSDGYTLEKATGSSKTVQEISDQVGDSIVEIKTESVATDSFMSQYVTEGAGSGIIIKSDGYIMTNNHVIEGASGITVTLKDGTEYDAELIATDSQADVAVLKIDEKNLTAATYGDSSELSVGDLAVVIGNPLGELGGTVTSGIISALDRTIQIDGQNMTLLQTDASVNPGNSGGGLFNQYGQLVGMVVAKSSGSDVEGLGFAIPINTAAEVAQQLIDNGKVEGRAAIGISIVEVTSQEQAYQYNVSKLGVYIQEVTSNEAKEAGLQAGDLIVSIDDNEISQAADLTSVISQHEIGDTVKLKVYRNGSTGEIKVKLTEAQ